MATKKSPFIQGFREPTLSKNSCLILGDVRGDGQGKLVIWSQEQSQLIVYKGSNRQLQKSVKIKNVSGIIQYQDQQRNAQSVIGLTAENAFYIFRGLSESFRLRVPDIFAEQEQQLIWSQYDANPQKLGDQLAKLDPRILTETAKYYLGSNSIERKKEIIQKVFDEGINEKDSISAIALLRNSQSNFMGNILLGTQLNRLYILDNYGHSIKSCRIMPFTPSILLGYGTLMDKYLIICIGRQGDICFYLQNDLNEPSEKLKNSIRIVSACLSFPDLILVGADQTITHNTISNSNFKLMVKKYTIKLGQQPIKAQFLKVKGQKMTIIGFQNQVRFYNEKELNYTFITDYKLYNVIWGSFARQQCCLILLYENAGFEVLILHRQFSIKQKYGSNRIIKEEYENIPFPKKSNHFLTFWNDDSDEALLYRHFEKSLKLLKWRTLREKFTDGNNKVQDKINVNSKILGLGPVFNIQIEIENTSEEVLFNIGLMFNFDKQKIELLKSENRISMIAPSTLFFLEIQIRSLSLKNESIILQLVNQTNITSSIIYIPSCQFGDQ